jgi:hypothetical protein
LLAHGRWFSPGIPGSSTTKTGRHDIAEILLQVALKHKKSIKQSSNDLYEQIIKWKTRNTTPSELFQSQISNSKNETKLTTQQQTNS